MTASEGSCDGWRSSWGNSQQEGNHRIWRSWCRCFLLRGHRGMCSTGSRALCTPRAPWLQAPALPRPGFVARSKGTPARPDPGQRAPVWQLPNTSIKPLSLRLPSRRMDFLSPSRGQEAGKRSCGLVCNPKPLPDCSTAPCSCWGGEGTGKVNKGRSSHNLATLITARGQRRPCSAPTGAAVLPSALTHGHGRAARSHHRTQSRWAELAGASSPPEGQLKGH